MYIACLNDVDEKLYSVIIVEIVETTKLSMVTDDGVASGSEAYILKLFDVIGIYLKNKKMGWASFFREPGFARLADALIARSLKEATMPGQILDLLAGDNKAIDSYIIRGCRFSGDNNQMLRWWRTMLRNRVRAEYLCDLIDANGIGVQEIENVLCQEIQINGYSESVRRLFNQYLVKTPGAGNAFYREWIKSVSGAKDRVGTLRRILTEIAANTNFSNLLSETLGELDREIRLEKSRDSSELAELVYEFALRTRQQCGNALLWQYLSTMSSTKISRRDKDGIAGVYLQANSGGYRIPASDSLLRSQLGEEFLMRMQEYNEQPATHIIALNSFAFNNASTHRAYVYQYARMILSDTVKNKSYALASIVYLREMVASGQLTQDQGADKLRKIFSSTDIMKQLDELLTAIQDELSNIRTDSMSDKMVAAVEKEYGKAIAKILEQMFVDAQETYKLNHQGENLFSKIFGRLKK